MLPQYIRVKNFTSYIDETIKFTDYGPIFVLTGENGAGKSSIVDMMTTALFYRNRATDNRGSGMDELVNTNSDRFEIEYVFTMNDITYKIISSKVRNGSRELQLFVNDIDHTGKINETQQKINDIIKMDYDTFLDTVCVGQGQSGRFMKKKPNERKDVFVQVLGLDKYELLENHTKELRKQTKEEIAKIENTLKDLQDKCSKLNDLETEVKEFTEEINQNKIVIKEKELELEKEVSDKARYDQIKKQREHILNQRTTLNKKINDITNLLTIDRSNLLKLENIIIDKDAVSIKLKETQDKLDELQDTYNLLSNKVTSLETTNSMLTSQAKEFKSKYDRLKDYNEATCSFCGHEITEQYKLDHLNELMTEGKKYILDINNNKSQIETFNGEILDIQNNLRKYKVELQEIQQKNNQISQAIVKIDSLKTKIKDSEINLEELKSEYDENLKLKVDEFEERVFNDVVLRGAISQLRSELTYCESRLAIAKNSIIEIEKSKNEIQQLEIKYSDLQLLFKDYDDLVIAWGKSGIQASIIENSLPEIENEINSLLDILCSGKVTVKFQTQKEDKGKKPKKATSIETLDIIINDENGSRTYETYSGGEQFRVDFACHVGLSKFLAKRAGATIDFFIIDEGLGSQDQEARQQFITSVYKLTGSFKQVMIVTHIEELKDAFESKILVTKDLINGSKVTLFKN